MTEDERDVLAANHAFYEAFAHADFKRMDALWARTVLVACVHPGHAIVLGRESVMQGWSDILRSGPPPVRCFSASPVILGDAAMVTCYEDVGVAQLAATNLFVREDGKWRLVHHHAGPVAVEAGPLRDAEWN